MQLIFIISLVIVLLSPSFVFASETNGTVDSTYKYAWSENIGWINFEVSGGNVAITDSGITGYAWSANHGWINLNPSSSGVSNNNEGTLSGSAWGENTGWIDFAGVTIDSSGYFSGYASGTVTGQISFNCANTSSCGSSDFKVRTDWRPRSARPACNNSTDDDGDGLTDYPLDPGCSSASDTDETDPVPVIGGGGLPPEAYSPPSAPAGGFSITINGGVGVTNNQYVTLSFNVGSDVKKLAISNTDDFKDASQEKYEPTIKWSLCSRFGRLVKLPNCPEGKYTVYAKFYTIYGRASQVVLDSIVYKKSVKIEHFTAAMLFNRNLRLGNRGKDVKALQEWLNQLDIHKLADRGPGSPGNETEYFGRLTFNALKKCQEYHKEQILTPIGLTAATGFFGPSTRAFANSFFLKQPSTEIPAATPLIQQPEALIQPTSAVFNRLLQYGTSHNDVKRLQRLLNSDPNTKLAESGVGSPGNETSYFGPITRNAVKKFQKKYNIVSFGDEKSTGYGLVGPKTRAKLREVFGGE